MGMSFGFQQSMQQTIAQRMEMAQAVGALILDLDVQLGIPTRSYTAMRDATVKLITDQTISAAVYSVLENRGVRDTVIKQPVLTAVLDATRQRSCIVKATYEYYSGDFIPVISPELSGASAYKMPFALFSDACLKPEATASEIALLAAAIGNSNKPARVRVAHLNEQRMAQRAATSTLDERTKCEAILALALKKLEDGGLPPLMKYSRELIFQREFMPIVSDRLLARLATNAAAGIKAPGRLEKVLRNAVCEFELVAMGILHPGIVAPADGAILEEIGRNPQLAESALGFNLVGEMLDRTGKRSVPVSLNESVVKLDDRAGQLIDSFLAGAFNRDWPEVLESLGGQDWVDSVDAEIQERRRTPELDDAYLSGISRSEFLELSKRMIVQRWYPALDPFIAERVQFA